MERFMCQVIFLHEDEIEAASAELIARGYELMISSHHEDFDNASAATKYGMIWKDFTDNVDPVKAGREFEDELLNALHLSVDEFGFVAPSHVPTRWLDFGEPCRPLIVRH